MMKMNKWIPVTERLLEDLMAVLTCNKNRNINIMWRYTYNPLNGNVEHRWEDNEGVMLADRQNENEIFDIVAWMELPEPYEENANDAV